RRKAATHRELLSDWPAGREPPAPCVLYDWLSRAFTAGWVRREGTGRRNDPYRFRLPTKADEYWDRGGLPPMELCLWTERPFERLAPTSPCCLFVGVRSIHESPNLRLDTFDSPGNCGMTLVTQVMSNLGNRFAVPERHDKALIPAVKERQNIPE